MIGKIDPFTPQLKKVGLAAKSAIGSQSLRPTSFQEKLALDPQIKANAKNAFVNGTSLLPAGALGQQRALNGSLGAKLNLFA